MATGITNPGAGADNKPNGFLAYANRHYPTAPPPIQEHSPPPPTFPPPSVSSYKQCMRNHAASIGGHALDGCCEFMPSPMFNSSDPTSLRCAACGCHRNFHRHTTDSSPASDSPPAAFSTPPQTLVNIRKRPAAASSGGTGKKRFRTRFSRDQKERMYGFAERLGWKMQRVDKRAVEEFCSEIGVGKEVLKVWMHNNKNTIGRNKEIDNNGGGSGDRLHLLSANGSSSSSQ